LLDSNNFAIDNELELGQKGGTMRKTRKNRQRFLLSLGTAIALSMVIHLVGGQKSPSAPDVWGVRIASISPNLISYPGDAIFKTEGSSSLVLVDTWYNRALKTDLTQIRLYLYENGEKYLSFPGAVADTHAHGDGEPCGFPAPSNSLNDPGCLEDFLGKLHPQQGYHHVYLIFTVYGKIDALPLNIRVPLTQGAVDFYIWTYDLCDEGLATYDHSVTSKVLNITNNESCGYFITRTGVDTWAIEVVNQTFEATEQYCEKIKTVNPKSGKVTTASKTYYPLKAMIPLSYSIEIIRNPI
jgi:hypothetical protein